MTTMEHRLIRDKYRVLREIDRGAFGTVYRAAVVAPTQVERAARAPEHVAVKVCHGVGVGVGVGSSSSVGGLQHEAMILNLLNRHHLSGVPRLHWYGNIDCEGGKKSTIVMTHYDRSLKQYVSSSSNSSSQVSGGFTAATVCRLVAQVVRILDHVHSVCVVHRDLKPDNLMMKGDEVHLIDFGLATFYVDGVTGDHILASLPRRPCDTIASLPRRPCDTIASLPRRPCDTIAQRIVGSPLYASYHVHAGHPHVRRDDLIQLGYIFLWLLGGMKLPWQAKDLTGTDHLNMCMEHKRLANVLSFSAHPGYRHYMETVYALDFAASPDYDRLVVV